MAKFHTDRDSIVFQCPGCKTGHRLPVEGPNAWQWNRDLDAPTLSPSIFVRSGKSTGGRVCHSHICEGRIQFLDDCTHELAGQTVDLPDWSDPTGQWDSGPVEPTT